MTPESSNGRCPYKGLQPFTAEDQRYFFGRDRERDIIDSNLDAAPLTILHGASGVGKSSVLMAGVLPQLGREPDTAVVLFRSWQRADFLSLLKDEVLKAVRAKIGDGVQADPTKRFSDFLAQCNRALGGPILFVLDQFEEYFLYHSPSAEQDGKSQEHFDTEFARAVNRRDVRANFLLSLRDDSLSRLDRFRGRIPNLLGNMLRLDHLDREAARDAIEKPLRKYNELHGGEPPVTIEAALVEELLDQVQTGRVTLDQTFRGDTKTADFDAEQRIETPFLQMVLERLWKAEREAKSYRLRLATLQALGGAERIVRTHLDDVMAGLGELIREHGATIDAERARAVAAGVFRFLVTPSGMKVAHFAADLASFAEQYSGKEVEDVLKLLALPDVRILRTVSQPGKAASQRYEIFHDVLGPAVLDWRARHVQRQEEERLKEEATIEAERKRVEAEQLAADKQRQLEHATALAELERRRAEEQGRRVEVEKSAARRFRWATIFLAILSILAISTSAFALYSWSDAQEATKTAQRATKEAQQATAKAQLATEEANKSKTEAEGQKLKAEGERKRAEDERERAEEKAAEALRQRKIADTAATNAKKSAFEALTAKRNETAAKLRAEGETIKAKESAAEAVAERKAKEEANRVLKDARDLDQLNREDIRLSHSSRKKELLEKFSDALKKYEELKDPRAELETLLNMIGINLDLGDEAEAIEKIGKARNKASNEELALVLASIGDHYKRQPLLSYRWIGGEPAALGHYRGAIASLEGRPDKDSPGSKEMQAALWQSIAESYPTVTDGSPSLGFAPTDPLKEIFAAFENAAKLYREVRDRKKEAAALTGAGDLALQRYYFEPGPGLEQKALHYYDRALMATREVNHIEGEIGLLQRLIAIRRRQGQVTVANDHKARVAGLYMTARDKESEASTRRDLGYGYVYPILDTSSPVLTPDAIANARRGIEFLSAAAKLFAEAGENSPAYKKASLKEQEARSLEKVGATYNALKETPAANEAYKRAVEAYEEALKRYEEASDPGAKDARIRVLKALARVYRDKMDIQKADEYERRARDLEGPRGAGGSTIPAPTPK